MQQSARGEANQSNGLAGFVLRPFQWSWWAADDEDASLCLQPAGEVCSASTGWRSRGRLRGWAQNQRSGAGACQAGGEGGRIFCKGKKKAALLWEAM